MNSLDSLVGLKEAEAKLEQELMKIRFMLAGAEIALKELESASCEKNSPPELTAELPPELKSQDNSASDLVSESESESESESKSDKAYQKMVDKVLSLVSSSDSVFAEHIIKSTGIPKRKVYKILDSLEKDGTIKKVNSKKWFEHKPKSEPKTEPKTKSETKPKPKPKPKLDSDRLHQERAGQVLSLVSSSNSRGGIFAGHMLRVLVSRVVWSTEYLIAWKKMGRLRK